VRLEQLVLYGPGDDDRLKFGPRITVFGGLAAPDRLELIETIVDALTGRLSNASVVYADARGRRVFADRTGATFADDGVVAPGPSELLGKDPATVAGLLTLSAADLGLGEHASAGELHELLGAARAALEDHHHDHVSLVEITAQIEDWRAELAEVDRRLASSDDDQAHWTWLERRRQLEELRAEVAMLDDHTAGDTSILSSVDALRTAGSAWADLAAAVSEVQAEVGAIPRVSAEDLARVAATPDAPPATFVARIDAWRAANDALRAAEAELRSCQATTAPAADPLVEEFARLDQQRLWAAHRRVTKASRTYNAVTAVAEAPEGDAETEREVELAHLEVVRAQRVVDERVRPGIIGAAALVAGALLAALSISPLVSVVLLAGAAAMVRWLVLVPRRELAAAEEAEAVALSATDAGSWLGLHLRRLDDITDTADRKRFESAANNWVVAQVEWEEIAGTRTPDQLTAREDEVRARAEQIDPKAVARRREAARRQRDTTVAAERTARASLTAGLEHFGFPPGSVGDDVDPDDLLRAVERRIEAGRVARRALKLASLQQRERSAAQHLESILARLGFTDGDLEGRLERAIQAVAVARQRQALESGARDRTDLEAEIARLAVIVERTRRTGWSESPALSAPPTDPDVLEARRRELAELIAAAGEPDVVGAEHRYRVGLARVRELERRLDDLSAGPESLEERLAERCGRTTLLDGADETVPVLVDDAFAPLPFEDKVRVLDHLVDLSEHAQVVLLTDDATTVRWARSRAASAPVVLFERDAPDPVDAEPSLSVR
jgi:hypothetical protein